MKNINDYHVIVTGGTRGIGRGITEAFLKEGATVIATYVGNTEAAEAFKSENENYIDKLFIKKFDVSNPLEVKEFYQYIDDKFESVEVLVNNSGIRKDGITATMSDRDWEDVLRINLSGSFYMTREIISRFMQNRFGRIINISSIGAQIGLPGQANYAASKAGQIAMAKTLSKEVAKKGITVNTLLPGFIDTDLLEGMAPEQIKEYKKQIPMKRFGRVDEVANAALFLSSSKASYITGACLEIAGGL